MKGQPGLLLRLRLAGAGLMLCGVACCLLVALLPGTIQFYLDKGIKEQIAWLPTSPKSVDDRFRYSNSSGGHPADLMTFWLWNVTNAGAVRRGFKPVLDQVGPYVYDVSRGRFDVQWSGPDASLVSFRSWASYSYVPELSGAGLDPYTDVVTCLNLPLLGALAHIEARLGPGSMSHWVSVVAGLVETFGGGSGVVDGVLMSRPVDQVLWGYTDPLLALLDRLLPPGTLGPRLSGGTFSLVTNMTMGPDDPAATRAPPTTANTGALSLSSVWNTVSSNGVDTVTAWGTGCEEVVRGTNAQQFAPGLSPDGSDDLLVWVDELFRAATLVFDRHVNLKGIQLLRYVPDPAQGQPDTCHRQSLAGLLNVTGPMASGPAANGSLDYPGPPILLSSPRYCQADPSLAAALDGDFRCDPQRHGTYVEVEPTTGITMHAYKRLQLSSQVTAAGAALDGGLPAGLILPLFWAEETSEISDKDAATFRGSAGRALLLQAVARSAVAKAATAGLITAALVLLLGAPCIAQRKQQQQQQQQAPGDEEAAAATQSHDSRGRQQQQQQQQAHCGYRAAPTAAAAAGLSDVDDALSSARLPLLANSWPAGGQQAEEEAAHCTSSHCGHVQDDLQKQPMLQCPSTSSSLTASSEAAGPTVADGLAPTPPQLKEPPGSYADAASDYGRLAAGSPTSYRHGSFEGLPRVHALSTTPPND